MKIIQSHAQFKEGTPHHGAEKKEFLNFYSFLLSYLTLKKYYGHVTMHCNRKAKESLIKYIPYDSVRIVENRNSPLFWSYYKVDVMSLMKEDFIHVDSDVFIFEDLFKKFTSSKKYDMIIQNQIPKRFNYVKNYVEDFRDFVIENNLVDPDKYDGRCLSCGTVGMRIQHLSGYINVCETIRKGFIEAKTIDKNFIGMASEELALYLYSLNNDFKIHDILPYDDILEHDERGAGDRNNYTHLYRGTKFETRYVKLVRNKILKDFPKYVTHIQRYEDEVMKGSKQLKEIIDENNTVVRTIR